MNKELNPIDNSSEEVTEALENEFDGYPLDCIVAELLTLRRDNGGTKGNENIVDGVVMCDFCSIERKSNE